MDRRIDAHIARTQFGQIMDLATKNDERFIVDRRGEPAVVIMSVRDFIRTAAPPPDWLEKAWTGAKQRGLDTLTPADVDAEIAAHRRKADPLTLSDLADHFAVHPADRIQFAGPIRLVMRPSQPGGLLLFPFRGHGIAERSRCI